MTPEQIELLAAWQAAVIEANSVKEIIKKEAELRKQVAASFFPSAKEGANTALLNAGWKLKFTNSYDYKLDNAAMDAVRQLLIEEGLSPDRYFKYTPSLIVAEYRAMCDNQYIVDAALTIKPKSPTLELIPPKAG